MIHRQEFEDNLTKELLSRLSIAIYKLPFAQDCLLLRTSVPQGCSPEHKWVLSVWLSVWYMSWADHVDAISMKINQRIGLIRRIRNLLLLQARVALYNALILPLFDYRDVIWGDKNNDTIMSELQILQNKAAKVNWSTEKSRFEVTVHKKVFSSLHCNPQVSYWRNRFQL